MSQSEHNQHDLLQELADARAREAQRRDDYDAEEYTCGCGIYIHESRRNSEAIHNDACPWATPLRLGDVAVGTVVFHSYHRVGKVVSQDVGGVWVAFMPEFDYRTRVLVREGKLILLGYQERIAAWTTAAA